MVSVLYCGKSLSALCVAVHFSNASCATRVAGPCGCAPYDDDCMKECIRQTEGTRPSCSSGPMGRGRRAGCV